MFYVTLFCWLYVIIIIIIIIIVVVNFIIIIWRPCLTNSCTSAYPLPPRKHNWSPGESQQSHEPQGQVTKKTLILFDIKTQMKIGLSYFGKINLACVILENAKTCLYGNKVADFSEINLVTVTFCYCPEMKN